MNKKISVDYQKIKFRKQDIIGEGTYSKVYKLNYNNNINDDYVVKKIKFDFLKKYYKSNPEKHIISDFDAETKALVHLSKKKISPKIYGIYKEPDNGVLFYILEKLDYTLGDLLRNNTFSRRNFDEFLQLLQNVLKTKYRHSDMHIDNVMYSVKRKQFMLIDLGMQKIVSKKNNTTGLYYTELDNQKNYSLFNSKKQFKNSIIGTSEASAIYLVYQYINLKKWNDKKQKLKNFIKKYSLPHMFNDIIYLLEKNTFSPVPVSSRKTKHKSKKTRFNISSRQTLKNY